MVLANYSAKVDGSGIATNAAFIYLIHIREIKALYVGQTYSKCGALGRLSQHLSDGSSNTLKQRVCSLYKYEEFEVDEVLFNAALLPRNKIFLRRESVYREAVEGLVNNRIINFASQYRIGAVISRIQLNPYTHLEYIQEEAERVAISFEKWLLQCHSSYQ